MILNILKRLLSFFSDPSDQAVVEEPLVQTSSQVDDVDNILQKLMDDLPTDTPEVTLADTLPTSPQSIDDAPPDEQLLLRREDATSIHQLSLKTAHDSDQMTKHTQSPEFESVTSQEESLEIKDFDSQSIRQRIREQELQERVDEELARRKEENTHRPTTLPLSTPQKEEINDESPNEPTLENLSVEERGMGEKNESLAFEEDANHHFELTSSFVDVKPLDLQDRGAKRRAQWDRLSDTSVHSIRGQVKYSVEQRASTLQGWLNSLHELIVLSEGLKNNPILKAGQSSKKMEKNVINDHWWINFHHFNQFLFERSINQPAVTSNQWKTEESLSTRKNGVAINKAVGRVVSKKRINSQRFISKIDEANSSSSS